MLPIASASGLAIIVFVVVCAGTLLAWLLRTETGEEDGQADEADRDGQR